MLEALEFERAREAALREQLEATATELEGPRIDDEVFATMSAEDAEIVRHALGEVDDEPLAEDAGEDWLLEDEEQTTEGDREELLAEIARLEGEMAESRRRQQAFERYLTAIGNL